MKVRFVNIGKSVTQQYQGRVERTLFGSGRWKRRRVSATSIKSAKRRCRSRSLAGPVTRSTWCTGGDHMLERVRDTGYSGMYLRVMKEGNVAARDPVELLKRPAG